MTKISQYPEISTPDVEDLLIGTDVENSNATKNFTIQSVIDLASIRPYKVYTALLSHIYPEDFSVQVLENNIGSTIVQRSGEGNYSIMFADLDPRIDINKITVFTGFQNYNVGDFVNRAKIVAAPYSGMFPESVQNIIIITTFDGVVSDNILDHTPIEIRVYN